MTSFTAIHNGTLDDGFEGDVWVCLVDGCFWLEFGGGLADSEIGFEFSDEHGESFKNMGGSFEDHFCVEGGDTFGHPTTTPTISAVPTKLPCFSGK